MHRIGRTPLVTVGTAVVPAACGGAVDDPVSETFDDAAE